MSKPPSQRALIYPYKGMVPDVSPGAWIAPTAVLIGEVVVEDEASVWFNVVVRADSGPIIIRAGSNVQDGSVLHGGHGPTEIGAGATIGHCCVVHSATIGEEALIGNGTIVLDRARIGPRTLVGAGSVVTPDSVLPSDVLAMGSPARVVGALSESQRNWVRVNPGEYRRLAADFAAELGEA